MALEQPMMGLDMTVTSVVKYTLTDLTTNEVVFDDVVKKAYTAKIGDAFVGTKRLRLANEGSIKGNISELISIMNDKVHEVAPIKMIEPMTDDVNVEPTS